MPISTATRIGRTTTVQCRTSSTHAYELCGAMSSAAFSSATKVASTPNTRIEAWIRSKLVRAPVASWSYVAKLFHASLSTSSSCTSHATRRARSPASPVFEDAQVACADDLLQHCVSGSTARRATRPRARPRCRRFPRPRTRSSRASSPPAPPASPLHLRPRRPSRCEPDPASASLSSTSSSVSPPHSSVSASAKCVWFGSSATRLPSAASASRESSPASPVPRRGGGGRRHPAAPAPRPRSP